MFQQNDARAIRCKHNEDTKPRIDKKLHAYIVKCAHPRDPDSPPMTLTYMWPIRRRSRGGATPSHPGAASRGRVSDTHVRKTDSLVTAQWTVHRWWLVCRVGDWWAGELIGVKSCAGMLCGCANSELLGGEVILDYFRRQDACAWMGMNETSEKTTGTGQSCGGIMYSLMETDMSKSQGNPAWASSATQHSKRSKNALQQSPGVTYWRQRKRDGETLSVWVCIARLFDLRFNRLMYRVQVSHVMSCHVVSCHTLGHTFIH